MAAKLSARAWRVFSFKNRLKNLLALGALFCSSALFAADVNTATAAELDAIKGIGPTMSARIMSEREKAPFKDWDDFKSRVKGVGNKNAAKLSQAGLTVGDASYPDAKATAKAESKPADAQPANAEKPKAGRKEKKAKTEPKAAQ